MTLSLKYDKLSATADYRPAVNNIPSHSDVKSNEPRSSPGKLPRQDYTSRGYTMKSEFNPEATGTSKPPTYKPLDYQSRNINAYDDQVSAIDETNLSNKYPPPPSRF